MRRKSCEKYKNAIVKYAHKMTKKLKKKNVPDGIYYMHVPG